MSTTTYNVTTSGELMENYIQSDILLPQDKFLALQTNVGASLLFSIGTGGVFNLTLESPGQTHGWRLNDISSAQIKKDFASKGTCTNFAAAQAISIQPGGSAQIHLAMVINDDTNDHLYISLSNSDSDLSWISAPVWTPCPYNAVDANNAPRTTPSPVKVAGVFICEATDQEYIVVDLIRNPAESAGVLERYYLDVTNPSIPTWTPHDVAGDISATGYQSSLGRIANSTGSMDGIYTKGTIASAAQLMYTPLVNVFDPTQPPEPSRLLLPNNLAADSIAASRNADNSSDLYVAAKGTLYYFASTNQKDEAVGIPLVSNALLTQVNKLYAYPSNGNITVWGLNSSDQVFYLTCPQNELTDASAWNLPLIIASNIDAISPYIDRSYSANTFFAHGADGLIKVVKAPGTRVWSEKNITLPPSDLKQPPIVLSSYTTHIQVNCADGKAAHDVTVSLTATNVTTVYINHLYYIVGPSPIEVKTDATGTITIVESVKTLGGTRYTAVVDSQPVDPINPMDSAFQRNSSYDSKEQLQAAKIVDRNGNTKDFVPAGTNPDDLDTVATSNSNLAQAYAGKKNQMPGAKTASVGKLGAAAVPQALVDAGYGSSVLADIGDLFRAIANAFEAVITFIEDVANEVWHLVVTIGEAIYHAVLDCVEHIVAAALWLYNAIKTVIEDIIHFLEFLFGWQDILTTHNVLKNLFVQTAQYAIDGIAGTKTKVTASLQSLQGNINAWAGIPNFDQTPSATSASNPPPAGQSSAPANLGVHHFKGNCASSSGSIPVTVRADSIFSDLAQIGQNERTTVSNAFSEIQSQIVDPFPTLTISQIIEKVVAILSDALIQSIENVVTAILDLIAQLTDGLMDMLTATIDIPVLSWLYKDITGSDLSVLDLLCLIAAIPTTLVYKIATNTTPFPSDDPFTVGLINAKSMADIRALFFVSPAPKLTSARAPMMLSDSMPVLDEARLKKNAYATGICACIGSIALVVVVNVQRLFSDGGSPFPKLFATIACIGNILYVSPNFPTFINVQTSSDWASDLNDAVTGVSILKGLAAIPVVNVADPGISRGLNIAFGIVETGINAAWNAPVINNILQNKAYIDTTYMSLVGESVANFAFNVGGMMEIFIVAAIDASDPPLWASLAAVQAAFMLTYGIGIAVASSMYALTPNQSH